MTDQPMYLTSISADEIPAGHRLDWADQTSLHRYVMSRFGDLDTVVEPHPGARILFRSEHVSGQRRLLIQSTVQPQGDTRTIDIKSTLNDLHAGTPCRLRVDINPVRRVARSGADRPLTDEEIPGWVRAKLRPGFEVTEIVDLTIDLRRAAHKRIVVAQIDAVANVADPTEARALVAGGVGRRKAHGCGLISVLPMKSN